MTTNNHPNRSTFAATLALLDRVSLDGRVEPDVRRLATAASQQMRAASERRAIVASDASYVNLYGADWADRKREASAAAVAERQTAMAAALEGAERFLTAWGYEVR